MALLGEGNKPLDGRLKGETSASIRRLRTRARAASTRPNMTRLWRRRCAGPTAKRDAGTSRIWPVEADQAGKNEAAGSGPGSGRRKLRPALPGERDRIESVQSPRALHGLVRRAGGLRRKPLRLRQARGLSYFAGVGYQALYFFHQLGRVIRNAVFDSPLDAAGGLAGIEHLQILEGIAVHDDQIRRPSGAHAA